MFFDRFFKKKKRKEIEKTEESDSFRMKNRTYLLCVKGDETMYVDTDHEAISRIVMDVNQNQTIRMVMESGKTALGSYRAIAVATVGDFLEFMDFSLKKDSVEEEVFVTVLAIEEDGVRVLREAVVASEVSELIGSSDRNDILANLLVA